MGSTVSEQVFSILVVDDDFDVRESLADVLTDEGYKVAAVADGEEALAFLRDNPRPNLILLDWMMPRCDGSQFRQAQRKDPAISSIPVVLLTADTKVDTRIAALDTEGYLTKPVRLDDLLATIERCAA